MSLSLDTSTLTSPLVGPVVKTEQSEKPWVCPFTIVVDTAEQQAFHFTGLRCDASKKFRPIVVNTVSDCLGRHPNSLGDYCIAEFRGRPGLECHLERKSLDDAIGTFLGFGSRNPDGSANVDTGRRQRFIQELANLNAIECGAIIIEANFDQVWKSAPETAKRTRETNQLSLRRQVRAWQQDFPNVQWLFAGGRREAEEEAYWWFARFYEQHKHELKG